MLRKRVITALTFNDGVLFRTKEFHPDYRYTLNFVDAWSVDEIVVLDVTRAPTDGREAFKSVIRDFSSRCFVPMAAGGGIRTLDDVRAYLDIGADKVILNTGAIERPEFISEVSRAFGKQCTVLCMDVRRVGESGHDYEVYSHFGKVPTGMNPVDWARKAEELGAGEILISSIERDGSLQGFELDVCRQVAQTVGIPVIICGGAGNWKHLEAGFKEGLADAVCATNIYHFTETSIHSAKSYLHKAGILVRQ